MNKQVIILDGFKFCRYPEAKRASDRNYYKGWVRVSGKWQKVALHRYVWQKTNGDIPTGFHIHHINGEYSDNRIENLHLISHAEHLSQHYDKYSQEYKDEKYDLLINKAIPKAVEWHKSDEGKEWHKNNTEKLIYTEEYTQICKGCGTEFKSNLRHKPKWCSKTCSTKYNARRYRGEGRYNEKHICGECGLVYETNKHRPNKFCSIACSLKNKSHKISD